MDWAVFSILLAIGILGVGLATLVLHLHKLQAQQNDSFRKAQNQRFDAFEKAQNQRFNAFEQAQNQRFDAFEQAQNQRFNDFKESQIQIQKIQSEKFDILIKEQRNITEQLTNHVAHLQEKQDSMQKTQEQMQKDIDEIKKLLQNKQT